MNFEKIYQEFITKINKMRRKKEVNSISIFSALSKLDRLEYTRPKKIEIRAECFDEKIPINGLIASNTSKLESNFMSRARPNNSATQMLLDKVTKTIEPPSKYS